MNVLGISCFFHDSAAAIVNLTDGILAAAEEERFTRKKHDHNFPINAVEYCMEKSGLSAGEIDIVAFYEEPWSKFNRVGYNYIKTIFRSHLNAGEILSGWIKQKFWVSELIESQLGIDRRRIKYFPHHMSHAFSAFGPSGFDSAAFLTLDGVGEWETATYGVFEDSQYKKLGSHQFPHSLGLMYSAFAEFLGFEVNDGEFKVMGMAAYGDPIYTNLIEKLFVVRDAFQIQLDMSFFSFDISSSTNLSKKFIKHFGPARERESEFLSADSDLKSFSNSKDLVLEAQKYYADIAASLQYVLENTIIGMVNCLQEKTKQKNLVYAGGVALNSVVNGKIVLGSKFDNVFIQPAAGDNGAALGAAFCGLGESLYTSRAALRLRTGALGKAYRRDDILAASKRNKYRHYREYPTSESLVTDIVERLLKKQVGALFQGGFEFGPRALGNRSIIADPRTADMKARVNHAVKFRELFRPFAPIVTAEDAASFFEFESPLKVHSQPFAFMMAVTNVKSDKQGVLEAITHVDGTARVQVIDQAGNPLLHSLLREFGRASGVPVLMNTSFNRRGEPIVNSPDEALSTFLWTDIDFLVMESFIFYKKETN